MMDEENKEKSSPPSGINLIRQRKLWLAQARETLTSKHEIYGPIEAPTKEGFVALAKLGKNIWNSWIEQYPDATPDFSNIDFREAKIDFSQFKFPNHDYHKPCVNFSHSIFAKNTSFAGAEFGHNANFSHTNFGDFSSFYGAIFGSSADFRNSTFGLSAYFIAARFGIFANFEGAIFESAAHFEKVSFGKHAEFKRTVFRGWSDFSASADNNQDPEQRRFQSISFAGAKFQGSVKFTGRSFESTTDFGRIEKFSNSSPAKPLRAGKRFSPTQESTIFEGIPSFHGCKFHQDTSFDGAVFKTPLNQEAARAFRTLKLAMEQLKATREEQRFFRLEMKAEHRSLPWGKRWISSLYDVFSDYGFSLWRPIAWLFIISLLFGAGYGILANACAANTECGKIAWSVNTGSAADRTSAVIKYTLASVSPVPGLDKMQTELRVPLFGHHGWIPITALVLEILHKIVALVMAFLFALALRNLFKMKS